MIYLIKEGRKKHKDQKYIDALLKSDEKVIREIYQQFSGKIISYVTRNSGDISDAEDIFQEALLDLHRKAHSGFSLAYPFEAYFMGICRYKWIDELKKRKKKREFISSKMTASEKKNSNGEMLNEIQEFVQKSKSYQLYIDNFKLLSSSCQEIIGLSIVENEVTGKVNSLKDVAEILKLNYSYVRRKHGECLKKLVESIKQYRNEIIKVKRNDKSI